MRPATGGPTATFRTTTGTGTRNRHRRRIALFTLAATKPLIGVSRSAPSPRHRGCCSIPSPDRWSLPRICPPVVAEAAVGTGAAANPRGSEVARTERVRATAAAVVVSPIPAIARSSSVVRRMRTMPPMVVGRLAGGGRNARPSAAAVVVARIRPPRSHRGEAVLEEDGPNRSCPVLVASSTRGMIVAVTSVPMVAMPIRATARILCPVVGFAIRLAMPRLSRSTTDCMMKRLPTDRLRDTSPMAVRRATRMVSRKTHTWPTMPTVMVMEARQRRKRWLQRFLWLRQTRT
mmetsp:Transcript_19896/g.43401  ORF Transcript_19896/g.43401 Transcript_19896/m.43401 type:complete len:290 (+) Transcript_19896:423-1292(+)